MRKLILVLPLLFLSLAAAFSQQSSKSKSKDRFREKDDPNSPVRVQNSTEINSTQTDNAPAFFQNGIVFVSSRQKSGPRNKRGETFTELYFAPFDPNGEPSAPQKFSLNLNSSLNEGAASFSRDFKTIYFTRNNMKNGVRKACKNGKVTLKIYEAQDGFPDWTDEKELPFNDDCYNCIDPSLSPDGTRLFFASDMPGGFGGYDIYVVEKNGNSWGSPVNLGPAINSEAQELSPFIALSGTLYFSSTGHNTIGGYDLFYVNNPLANPEEVVNLGTPFNSEADDVSLIIDDDGRTGFFASNRVKGYGKDDIFRFEIPKGIEGVSKPRSTDAQIIVTDAKTGEPLQGASIRLLQASGDGFVNGQEDIFEIDLLPMQNKANELSFRLVRKNANDLGKPDYFTNAVGQARTEFLPYRTYFVLVSHDGYSTSERMLSTESIINGEVRFSLKDAPVCHRAGGLVAASDFGTRIANANVKFVHKATGQAETVRTNLNGEFDVCLPADGDYLVSIEREGFKPETATITASRSRTANREFRLRSTIAGATPEATVALASGFQEGSIITMDKIFYDYHKATLNQGAVRHFNALFEMMEKYPEMEIDLVSHTDTRGDAPLNLELTEERAKNAKAYLEHLGIAPSRINAYGKGETEPRNRCTEGVECSDQEHMENSRIEIRIRKLGKTQRP